MEKFFKNVIVAMAIVSTLSLIGYAVAYLIKMPAVSPNGFVQGTVVKSPESFWNFGTLNILFVLVYAFSLIPVIVLFTVKNYKTNPYGMILSGSLLVLSFVLEIVNNLPLISSMIMRIKQPAVSPDIMLYMQQLNAIRFLGFDVAGFTLAYIAFGIYALIYFKTNKLLSYTVIGSIVTFIANVPFLWIVPAMAVLLMSVSILAFAVIPILLVKMSVE